MTRHGIVRWLVLGSVCFAPFAAAAADISSNTVSAPLTDLTASSPTAMTPPFFSTAPLTNVSSLTVSETVASSGAIAAPHVSTETFAVWQTGETKSQPFPQALTQPKGGMPFYSLDGRATPRTRLPTDATYIDPDESRKWDAQNLGEILAHEVGVQMPVTQEISVPKLLSLRGATPEQTLILLDGRPVSGLLLSAPNLVEIPVEQIDHIEIVKGNASGLYGGYAPGGVINVISRRSSYSGIPISHFTFENGDFGRQAYRLDLGNRLGRFDYTFFADDQRESGFRMNSDARQHNIGGNMGLAMGKAGKLLLDIASYHQNAGEPNALFPTLPTGTYNDLLETQTNTPYARQITQSDYVRSSYIVPISSSVSFTFRAFGEQREVQYQDPTTVAQTDRHEQSKGGEAQFNLPAGVMLGTNFIHDREDYSDQINRGNSFRASGETWGAFVQESFVWKVLSLIPSLRYDHSSLVGDSTNPRVLASVDATPWLRVSGSTGRSFRAPTFDNLYLHSPTYNGNASIPGEKTWTTDGGFELHRDSESLKFTYFRANVTDFIQTLPAAQGGVSSLSNVHRQGFEIEARCDRSVHFENRVNYTYLKSRGNVLSNPDAELAYTPTQTVNYINTYRPQKNWSLDNVFRYNTQQFSGNDETGDRLGARFLWDLRVAYQLRQLEVYAGLADVTNRRYEDPSGFPEPGRMFYGGLTIRLWG